MIIIPARIKSSRFPNKVLADIGGLPMVIKSAFIAKNVDDVVIATDSYDVVDVAKKFNIKAIMTKESHNSGTDRVNECAEILGLSENETVINMQADEPFLEEEILIQLKERMKSDKFMASCYKVITQHDSFDPNVVKVVVDDESNAIYFSRSKIPFDRDEVGVKYFGHLGVYGFKRTTLREFCNFKSCELENIEKLEQLRAIYYGKKISMIKVESRSFGIDTLEDLERAKEKFL